MDPASFTVDESCARALDAADPLAPCRGLFCIPPSRARGEDESVYLCGNSLGCMPRAARDAVVHELDAWERLGVDAHVEGAHPWVSYHEEMRGPAARLVGAREDEVVLMNSLTVNLHLMLVTFYRPTRSRFAILVEDAAFPSDAYAVASHASYHGHDPAHAVIRLRPRPGEHALRTEDIEAGIDRLADRLALVLLPAVNYLTGEVFDVERVTRRAHAAGVPIGWDLAHAAGNIPLRLHDWDADFAVWCSYKYLNAGPGSVAGCFIHQRCANAPGLPRFEGWWGSDPATRFLMRPGFTPAPGADAWQLSNPPILSFAPVRVSLDIFDRAGMSALRAKSERLTGYARFLLGPLGSDAIEIITPADPGRRGCQLSIAVRDRPRELLASLRAAEVVADYREPGVIRIAPVPLYNTFHDVWEFARVLAQHVEARPRPSRQVRA